MLELEQASFCTLIITFFSWKSSFHLYDNMQKQMLLHRQWPKTIKAWEIYLPSPPQPRLGVTSTSRQLSKSVLYTYSFSSFPSYFPSTEKKSCSCLEASDQTSAALVLESTLGNLPHLVAEAVRPYDVVSVGPQTGLSCRRVRLHVLQQNSNIWRNSRKRRNEKHFAQD